MAKFLDFCCLMENVNQQKHHFGVECEKKIGKWELEIVGGVVSHFSPHFPFFFFDGIFFFFFFFFPGGHYVFVSSLPIFFLTRCLFNPPKNKGGRNETLVYVILECVSVAFWLKMNRGTQVIGLAVWLACLGIVLGQDPPEPQWPNEVTMVYASAEFQYFVNYSYGSQKLFLDYHSPKNQRNQIYLSCNEETETGGLLYYYSGSPAIGQVCYQESASDFDEYLCPLPSNPSHYLVGTNFTYNGIAKFEGQRLYTWMNGYDLNTGECIDCTFYWESAVYSPEFRTPVAADFQVVDTKNPPNAGYFQNYYSPILTDNKAIQPVNPLPGFQCHISHPPFSPPSSKATFETTETVPLFRLMDKLRNRRH